jgi:hypothetical protein
VSELGSSSFIGDNSTRGHGILWQKEHYLSRKGGIPAPAETAQVVIVGGGIAGLAAANALRDLNPIVLEQSTQFGGNAKGERWGDLEYGIGSAYIADPDAGSPLDKLLAELGLRERTRLNDPAEEGVVLTDKVVPAFWKGGTDPARAAEFIRVRKQLIELGHEAYPAIPPRNAEEMARVEALDRMSFAQWARKNLGKLHPHVEELFHEYCEDAFACRYDEVSAAQAINFIIPDLVGVLALPGGNGAISEALYKKLSRELKTGSLRAGSFVADVALNSEGVRVAYEDPEGNLRSIQARACVVAAPKFIAARVVRDMPKNQHHAVAKLRYRAFLVANVLVKGVARSPWLGMFRLRGEHGPKEQAFSTVVHGAWAGDHRAHDSSLTLYKSYPHDHGRGELNGKHAFEHARKSFEGDLPILLRALGLDESRVAGLRIARWGHAIPAAVKGMLVDGVAREAAAPVGGRIFLGQQDNWASPCVESALNAAYEAAEGARKVVLAGA